MSDRGEQAGPGSVNPGSADPGSIDPSQPGSTAGKACDNCQSACAVDDIFCERCGYDFITGSMPGAAVQGATATAGSASSASPTGHDSVPSVLDTAPQSVVGTGARVLIDIGVDRDYFASVVTEGEVSFPSLLPSDQRLELHGDELHVGRTSSSRGIHPTIDVEALTGDPAVSSQHALLRVAADGSVTVVDVGSTNGTFVGSYDGDPVTQGVAVDLSPGVPVYVGAWTRLTVVGG